MNEIRLLLQNRLRIILNAVLQIREHSRLKLFVVTCFAVGVLAGLFLLFHEMFRFLSGFEEFKATLSAYLFSIFFLSLGIMLFFSTAIIAFTGIFHSREAHFLVAMPLHAENLFAYKMAEAAVFSSWAFMLLGMPLIIAYGITSAVPWYFYPVSVLFFAVFAGIPAWAGGTAALAVGTFFPRNRKLLLGIAASIMALIGLKVVLGLIGGGHKPFQSMDRWVTSILSKISFCQNAFLPSQWMARGVLAASRRDLYEMFFQFLLILSNMLFVGLIAYLAAKKIYPRGWSVCRGATAARKYRTQAPLYTLLDRALPFLSRPVRMLVVKDAKNFFRDPSQWSQVLIFAGLIGIYNLNLRNLSYDIAGPAWKNIIAFLNLAATALALSSFTGRFIFPMLSLEGRRFWILGLLPVERKSILMGKLFFSAAGSIAISEALIITSDYMLRTGPAMIVLHIVTVAVICLGLSAIAVGLGATFPNLKEDNPSKIVAGFGGTLCLMISLAFIMIEVILLALPCHFYLAWKAISAGTFKLWMAAAVAAAFAVAALAVIIPMKAGLRAFERLEF